jgi:hypothetical protein
MDLLLHGHQHEPVSEVRRDPDRSLRVLAAGSLYEGDEGDRWINSFHAIDAELDERGRMLRYEVCFFGWSPNGHWYASGAIYKSAPRCVLSIDLVRSASSADAPQPDAVWYLVQRPQALDAIKHKLLTEKRPALALVGMSGVGKSTLAAELARDAEVVKAWPAPGAYAAERYFPTQWHCRLFVPLR